MSLPRNLSFSLAINESIHQLMESDPSVFVLGQGVKSPWYVGNTVQGLLDRFGPERVIDTPVSENAMTGAAVGAAIAGMRPIIVYPRMDFMLYAMDPIINQAANWYYMNGGSSPVSVVFWGIINRGGEQAAQHSQALQATFAHIPGLKVVMPSSPEDAKGLMTAAVRDPNPVIYIDDRLLYASNGPVPEDLFETPIGKGHVLREGGDLTMVAISQAVQLAEKATVQLSQAGIDVELIDPRTIKPLDTELILSSVRKTGRILVVDPGWRSFGVSAEIVALVTEKAFNALNAAPARLALPDTPAPASRSLEKIFFLNESRIIEAAMEVMR